MSEKHPIDKYTELAFLLSHDLYFITNLVNVFARLSDIYIEKEKRPSSDGLGTL
jgi:hypothetical protein